VKVREAVVALGSLQEELARRLAECRQRIVELGEQMAEVQSRLEAEEDRLSRLVITRERWRRFWASRPRLPLDPRR
jgi:chromosome segregation ATPase